MTRHADVSVANVARIRRDLERLPPGAEHWGNVESAAAHSVCRMCNQDNPGVVHLKGPALPPQAGMAGIYRLPK